MAVITRIQFQQSVRLAPNRETYHFKLWHVPFVLAGLVLLTILGLVAGWEVLQ